MPSARASYFSIVSLFLLSEKVGAGDWDDGDALGQTWTDRNAFSYGRGGERGQARPEVLQARYVHTKSTPVCSGCIFSQQYITCPVKRECTYNCIMLQIYLSDRSMSISYYSRKKNRAVQDELLIGGDRSSSTDCSLCSVCHETKPEVRVPRCSRT